MKRDFLGTLGKNFCCYEGVNAQKGVANSKTTHIPIVEFNFEQSRVNRFLEYLDYPGTKIIVQNFKQITNILKHNPKFGLKLLLGTMNCIDGRPVLLNNSMSLLLLFLKQNNFAYSDEAFSDYLKIYLNDPIRKKRFEDQTQHTTESIKQASHAYSQSDFFAELSRQKDLHDGNLVDLLVEGTGFPAGGLGFAITYFDTVLKNIGLLESKFGYKKTELLDKIEQFFREYGKTMYYHSCNNNYGAESGCKHGGCAAMNHFQHQENVDPKIKFLVEEYVLNNPNRKSAILNGRHEENNSAVISNSTDPDIGVGMRNDNGKAENSQAFVLNQQMNNITFDIVHKEVFGDNQGLYSFMYEAFNNNFLSHVGSINQALKNHGGLDIQMIANVDDGDKAKINSASALAHCL